MYKIIHNDQEIEINYRNDIVFKKTLGDNDPDSKTALKFLLSAIIKKSFQNVEVINSEMLGKFILSKKNYLDIRATDENEDIYQIEMQQKYLDEFQLKRLQQYAYRSVANGLKTGQKYTNIKHIYQIVFTTEKYNGKLLTEYRQREEDGKEMKHNLVSFFIISLPYIEDILKEKRKLSDLEVLSYVYQKEVDDAIIEVADERQKKVLEIMNKKLIELLNEEDILDEATQAALYEEEQIFQQKAAQAVGEEIGIELGIERGKELGKELGKEIGIHQGKLEYVHKLVEKLYDKEAKWLDDCNLEQLEKAFDLTFNGLDYQQFKAETLKNR